LNIMKIQSVTFVLMAGLSMATFLSACSDDKPAETQTTVSSTSSAAKKPTRVHNPFDHSHDEVVTDVVKHQFEHEFADQCVARELKASNNPDVDKPRLDKDCMCIAQYMMKDLSAEDAKHFLKQHENTHSLQIKFDAAAFFCIQNKQQPKGPHLFGKKN
jgi:ABC-type Zn2+ transport system substrate-binding protein/surface adhesin